MICFKNRFRREAFTMARLSHPGIVSVIDFGETSVQANQDGKYLLYIVMEYVEGSDLAHLIETSALNQNQILAIIIQICEALQYAHNLNIIHRDIKPSNIMLSMNGTIKIADFGLAKIIPSAFTKELSQTATAPHIVIGTIDYLAPEQTAPDGKIDHRTDIYALGVLICELLTGKTPCSGFCLPSSVVEDLDPRLDKLVLRSMTSKPAGRFQSVSEIASALLNIITQTPATVPLAGIGASKKYDSGKIKHQASTRESSPLKKTEAIV